MISLRRKHFMTGKRSVFVMFVCLHGFEDFVCLFVCLFGCLDKNPKIYTSLPVSGGK